MEKQQEYFSFESHAEISFLLLEFSLIISFVPDFDIWQSCSTSLHFHSHSCILNAAGHFPILSHGLFPEPAKSRNIAYPC